MSTEALPPLESGKFIAENSQDVKVLQEGVKKAANVIFESLRKGEFSVELWKGAGATDGHELNPKVMDEKAVDWIFLVDTLNFSFWSEDEGKKYKVTYKGQTYTGYWSLCAAVNRAMEEGVPITNPGYYAGMTLQELAYLLRSDSDVDMPMLQDRVNNLQEAGKVLKEKFDGSFVNCIKKCGGSAQKLLSLVVSNFSSYRDEAVYKDKTVAIYKRAQILIADIWSCFEGQGYGSFDDISSITMFADYRVPQALLYFDALEYSQALLDKLNNNHMFTSGEREEVEIRGCSIWAVKLIEDEISRMVAADPAAKNVMVNAILVDNYLWDLRRAQRSDMDKLPFHRIRTIYY
ncbi:PREDICTED: UPF0553 protein C9orf64-like [Branchiostoma belcheri]|uniref:Queuosine 5'-phosphate N-glycosylase/hydrolase n=1 Tax=Branchiostoma belcheri TaxID=7741 RepID=A0A6P4ZAI0_BRABE|nr:PREDICTED: UPF0553 protein C9orf64-like [Branchiostoma belcheri]XP_019633644.1 PREDICTED: UPF0553 protein C9orf64-like [Branchiostoma belcheri]